MWYANERDGADIEKKIIKGAELTHIPSAMENKDMNESVYANKMGGSDIILKNVDQRDRTDTVYLS